MESRGGKSQRRESEKEEDQMKKRRWEESEIGMSQTKEDAGAREGGKVATPCVFPLICTCVGSTSRRA